MDDWRRALEGNTSLQETKEISKRPGSRNQPDPKVRGASSVKMSGGGAGDLR